MKTSLFSAKTARLPEDPKLQITAMASVFTVILVFLLKSFSPQVSEEVSISQQLTLPESAEAGENFEGLRLEVSATGIRVDDQAVVRLDHFNFDPRDLAEDGGFKPVDDAIRRSQSLDSTRPAPRDAHEALVLADVKTPYSILKRVFTSASNQGYANVKLIVIREP